MAIIRTQTPIYNRTVLLLQRHGKLTSRELANIEGISIATANQRLMEVYKKSPELIKIEQRLGVADTTKWLKTYVAIQ